MASGSFWAPLPLEWIPAVSMMASITGFQKQEQTDHLLVFFYPKIMLFPLKPTAPCQLSPGESEDYRKTGMSKVRIFLSTSYYSFSVLTLGWLRTAIGQQTHLGFSGPSINQSLNLQVDWKHKRSEGQTDRPIFSKWERDKFHLLEGEIVPRAGSSQGSRAARVTDNSTLFHPTFWIFTSLAIHRLKHLPS